MTRPASYNRVWAEDASADQMGGEATTADQGVIEQGWVGSASAEPPTARMQNYWQIRVDMGLQEIEQQGFLAWRSDVPYKKASLVYFAGYLFQANSANTNITPQGVSDNNIWSLIQPGNWPTTPDSFTGTLPIAKGGTGATNQSDALSNLGGAPIASPVLTGDPKAPTPATGDSDTSIATTAFVQAAMAVYGVGPTSKQVTDANAVPGSGIYFASGSASNLPVAAFGTLIHDQATTNVASQLFIATTANQLWTRTQTAATTWTAWAQYAGIASPAFTGNPTAPTATVGDNDTSIATTAFVQAAMAVYGIGSGSSTQVTDANLALVGGFSRMASAGLNKPVTGGGTLLVMPSFSNNITQMFVDATASANVFTRISTDTGVTWGAWSQQVGMTLAGVNSTIKSLTGLTAPLAVPAAVSSGQAMQLGQAVGRLIGVKFFGSSGTYTPTTGTLSIVVEIVGGGGGGGAARATNTGNYAGGSGGGAGAYAKSRITTGIVSTAVTIGSGGAGATNSNGGNGGASSFGSLITCAGGAGGSYLTSQTAYGGVTQLSGGYGGSASGGSLVNALGGQGDRLLLSATNNNTAGVGGTSFWSCGGGGAQGGNGTGAAGTYGSGGGGSLSDAAPSGGSAGGNGGTGFCIVWEYA